MMKYKEDQSLAWFLFKGAFQMFFAFILFSFAALINEDYVAEELNKFLNELKTDFNNEKEED